VETGTDREAEGWLRRSAYFLDVPSLLDLERPLPVSVLRVHELLELVAGDDRPALSLILVRLSPLEPRSRKRAAEKVPWLEDLPHSEKAIHQLCTQGWLLIGCGPLQGLALSQSVRRGRGILASRYELGRAEGRPPQAGGQGEILNPPARSPA
jgi:hypothetical protein